MDTNKSEGLINLQEAALLLGISPLSISRHFPTIKLGRRRLVRRSAVLSVINGGDQDVSA